MMYINNKNPQKNKVTRENYFITYSLYVITEFDNRVNL